MTAVGVWDFDAIGTRWQIVMPAAPDDGVRERVSAVIDAFDREWSRFRPDSLVTTLSGGGRVTAPVDAADMLDTYAALSRATEGAVNPLVGGSLARRGYDAAFSLTDGGAAPTPAAWDDVLSWAHGVLQLSAPALIDVGALGKGRLVDLVAAALGDEPAVVDAGGDIRVRGRTERIALEHPYDSATAIGVWEITDGALCASATNRRAWGDGLHHVLDARTGQPVRTVAATWAAAPTAMIADAAATALFFDGGVALAHEWDAPWVRMLSDGRVEWSPGCPADLFLPR